MAKLNLSLACSDNPRTQPIIDGRVRPDGIEIHVTMLHPSELFWRQLRFEEFDVSEMSLSSLLMAVAHGDRRWVGVPIFTSRRFFHTGVLVRAGSGIEKPEDLKGKRVGVPEYQQTAALWTRAALQQLYGVRDEEMEWWMGFFPINHGVVIKRELHEQHPWVLLNIFNAFLKAKELVNAQARELAGPFFETGLLPSASHKAMSTELFAYGVRSNRTILEAISRFSHEQGLTPRVLGLEEVFAPQTMDL